jgi:D-xylose transport system permease protein
LLVIALYFGSQTSWIFLNARNMSNLVLQIAAIGSVAIGIVLVLLLGEIDLSVGSVAGLTSAILGVLVVYHGWPWWLAIIAMLAVGAAIGAFQGAWFATFGMPAFVVTLAGFLFWQDVQLRVLGSNGTVNVFEPHIDKIAATYLSNAWGWAFGVGFAVLYATTNLLNHGAAGYGALLVELDAAGSVCIPFVRVAECRVSWAIYRHERTRWPEAGLMVSRADRQSDWASQQRGQG